MGRQKEPIDLLLAKGNMHLTNEQIENRRAEELNVPVGDITPPDYLPEKLKDEFTEVAEKLVKINIMTDLDVDLLARYLLSKQTYLALTNKYIKALSSGDEEKAAKLSNMQDKALKQCQSAARDLGLTISSRCRLVIPKAEEPPPSKWDRFRCG